MNHHHAEHEEVHTSTHDDFPVRLKKNLLKELLFALKNSIVCYRILMTLIIGVILFLKEFDFVKILLPLIIPPVIIFFVGSHLTLLPGYLVFGMTIVAIMSLSLSEKGEKLGEWFVAIWASLFEGTAESTSSPLPQKLIGFVGFSAVVSFFAILIM
jgi:hypothetical protein